jgi:hypothetical protein
MKKLAVIATLLSILSFVPQPAKADLADARIAGALIGVAWAGCVMPALSQEIYNWEYRNKVQSWNNRVENFIAQSKQNIPGIKALAIGAFAGAFVAHAVCDPQSTVLFVSGLFSKGFAFMKHVGEEALAASANVA